jgi:hypothetical protein
MGSSYGHWPTDQPFSVAGQESFLILIGIPYQLPFCAPQLLDQPAAF